MFNFAIFVAFSVVLLYLAVYLLMWPINLIRAFLSSEKGAAFRQAIFEMQTSFAYFFVFVFVYLILGIIFWLVFSNYSGSGFEFGLAAILFLLFLLFPYMRVLIGSLRERSFSAVGGFFSREDCLTKALKTFILYAFCSALVYALFLFVFITLKEGVLTALHYLAIKEAPDYAPPLLSSNLFSLSLMVGLMVFSLGVAQWKNSYRWLGGGKLERKGLYLFLISAVVAFLLAFFSLLPLIMGLIALSFFAVPVLEKYVELQDTKVWQDFKIYLPVIIIHYLLYFSLYF